MVSVAVDERPQERAINRSGVLVVGLVAVAAAVLRLGPLLLRGTSGRSFAFDESVYFLGAQHLWSGSLPYRDFVFVHPPGLLVGLGPAAWLAAWTGDATALLVAQVVVALIGAACAGLVATLLLRYGVMAAVFGGVLYAVWSATVLAETAVLMEPVLNLLVLIALVLLRRRRCAAAGVALGLALTVKLWAIVPLVVLAVWVAVRYGRRRVARFALGAVGAASVVTLPFFVAAPGRMWTDVIAFQAGRLRSDTGMSRRAFFFTGNVIGYDLLSAAVWFTVGVILLLLAALPLVHALIRRRSPARWDDPAWWSALTLTLVLALLWSPTFYDHYAAFAAPPVCLLAGYGVHVVAARMSGRIGGGVLGAAGVVVLAVLALGTLSVSGVRPQQPTGLADAVAGRDCVWSYDPALLIAADVSGDQIARDCPMFVDRYATAIAEVDVTDADLDASLPSATDYQRQILDQWRGSDAVLITGAQLFELAPETIAVLREEFSFDRMVGGYQLWVR